jgi:hypothetical protein
MWLASAQRTSARTTAMRTMATMTAVDQRENRPIVVATPDLLVG